MTDHPLRYHEIFIASLFLIAIDTPVCDPFCSIMERHDHIGISNIHNQQHISILHVRGTLPQIEHWLRKESFRERQQARCSQQSFDHAPDGISSNPLVLKDQMVTPL